MNRRGFLGTVAGAAALNQVACEALPSGPAVEPYPSAFDFEPAYRGYDMDVSTVGVDHALDTLGWEPDAAPKPLLCVHPMNYRMAIEIAGYYAGAIAVKAARFSEDRDTWFIAWRGRRVGSVGA